MGNKGLLIAISLLGWSSLAGCQMPPQTQSSVMPVSATEDTSTLRLRTSSSAAASQEDVSGMGSNQSTAKQETLQERYERWVQRKIAGQERPQHPGGGEQSITKAAASYQGSDAGTSLNSTTPKDSSDDTGFDWSNLEPENLWKSTKKAFGYGPNEPFAQQTYREGMDLYRARNYDEAAKKFSTAADRWPDSTLEEDALFYQAESYFFADRYSQANDTLQVLFKKYPNTRYLDTCVSRQFAIGQYWEQVYRADPRWPITPNFTDKTQPLFHTSGNAEGAYTSVQLNDPTGPLADAALMAKANFLFERGYFEEAARCYETIRRDYPRSKYQVKAHILGMQAERQVYSGAYYDIAPLKNADQIASQTLKQFPGKLGDERAKIVEERAEMREQHAERYYAAAQFWEKKKAFGSARIYYHEILTQYPGTECSAHAKERLDAIKDEPDEPPKHLQWLSDIFDRKR